MNKKGLTSFERRMDIMFYLSEERETHYFDLRQRYNVSNPVLKKDLDILETIFGVPLYRVRGRNGYIKIFGNWVARYRHLNSIQEKALIEILKLIPEQYREIINSILVDFGTKKL